MHSVLLVVLGAYLAQGVLLEQHDSRSKDTSDKFRDVEFDIVERNGEYFANQHPLAQPDDTLDEKISIDPNLNIVDQAINTVEPSPVQTPRSEDKQSNTHSILKRVPGFITFTELFYTPVVTTRIIPVSVPFTQGSEGFVTIIREGAEPLTITEFEIGAQTTTTKVFTKSGTVYQVTVPPASATEEFFTSTYLAETLASTITVLKGVYVPFTVTKPGAVTITEGRTTVTVTETFTLTLNVFQTRFIPVATQTIVVPGDGRPIPTTDSQ